MAAADGDVEQLLATKTATPIAQLGPELSDQATRKVHGEVTITWPFSSVSKSLAFLVAEPDFRLRRDKGQVRVQLNGPSAEAVGALELGSGDEVTLGLDGVEWARDEEPARPPGSRSDWQLKFVGKLTLKVTLGESQETKFINIDQPVSNEPEEAFEPIPFAEIDTTLFDDEPVTQNSARPAVNEYASPIFMKRSRASYAPLFEFDLDEELEADGGRRGKGRKRPRYSVQNGRWRYREESSSPEPEMPEHSPSPPSATDGDVVMPDAPSKAQTADGACQTVELELPPPPKSVENTPTRAPGGAPPSSPPLSGRLPAQYTGATTDTGVQASTSSLQAVDPGQQRPPPTAERPIASLFEPPPSASGFSESNANLQAGFGIPQSMAHPTQSHQGTESPHHFGGHAVPNQPHFGQPTNSQSIFGQSGFGQNVFGQPSSFGAGFGQPSNGAAGFGALGGPSAESVRFGFGEQPQSAFGGMPFGHHEAHFQPEAYPDPQQSPASASPPSHRSSEHATQHSQSNQAMHETHTHVSEPQIGNSGAPLWAAAPQSSGPWHALGHVHNPEDLLSDSSAPVGTPPGMIPPGVEDGTRNQDEMREQGILSQPVFEQGVPREALPHGRESSADDDEDSMDSDERADYDEDEKGDDYDMRNYDRISDDEEDLDDGRRGPLPDEDLLEEDEEFDEDEEDYDEEEDYEEEEPVNQTAYQQPILQRAPLPQAPKQPIVIDLLSDSDDDEEPAPPPPKSQLGRQQMDGIAKSEPETFSRGHPAAGSLAPSLQHRQTATESEPESHGSAEGEDNELEGEDKNSLVDEERSSEPQNDEGSEDDGDMDVDRPTHAEASDDVERTSELEVPYRSVASATQAEGASLSTGQSRKESQLGEGSNIKEAVSKVDSTVEHTPDQRAVGLVLNKEEDELSEDQDDADERVAHLQPGPIELAATFRAQSRDVAASFETQVMDSAASNITSSSPGRGPISENSHTRSADLNASFQTQTGDVAGSFQSQVLEPHTSLDLSSSPHRQDLVSAAAQDTLMDDGQSDGADDERTSELGEDASGQEVHEERAEQQSEQESEVSNQEWDGADTTGLEVTPNIRNEMSESKSFEGFSDEPEEAPPSPPESQHREGPVTRSMDISMTNVSSHVETQITDEKGVFQTRDTEIVLMQPDVDGGDTEMRTTDDKVAETANQAVSGTGELESDSESIKNGRAASHDEAPLDQDEDLAMSEAISEPLGNEIVAVSSPLQPTDPEEAGESRTIDLGGKEAATALSDEEDFHDASELLQVEESPSAAHFDDRASFVTANSQASESREAEDAESPSVRKSKRSSRIRALREESSIQIAKSSRASKRGSRMPPDQSPSPRTTRSQTMSFQQAASPTHEQEDMFARAGLRSPSRRKVSATSANKAKNDLIKRLGTEMPECAPLKDFKSYNMNTLDVAAVVTSSNTTPQRTKARQYVSSFTISDPSTAPQGAIEVSLFRAHKDYLPVVKPGDSILLRRFTVTSLPGRGFGLRTEDESSWAVFNADGEDAAPQVRGPPVELSDKEKSYLVDLRAWYAALDEAAKEKLAGAVGELVQKGKESRGEK